MKYQRNEAPILLIEEVWKGFDEGGQRRDVLRGASAEIMRGETVALLGRSGSGKSTLLNILSGIDAPEQGAVIIDGTALHALRERERTLFRRAQIGFVFQFFNLIPTLTVEENILLPLELKGPLRQTDRDRVRELLDGVGLADRGPAFPDKLSGGEQQRVAIARALAHDPALVLADEPTGNLDAATGAQILALLDRMVRQAGKTMVLVTHSADVARAADRILQLEEGLLVERALAEVMA